MRHLARRLAPLRIGESAGLRALAAAPFFVGALLAGLASAEAREVRVRGAFEKGFARIEFTFDQTTKVSARNSGSILVLSFADPAEVKAEKLSQELQGLVSTVRRDPDGSGLRIALQRPVKPNILEAGERVFVDLLPERWTGLPPGLPPDVVAQLAERARRAEAVLKEEAARRAGPVRNVVLRLAQSEEQTRFVFEPPAGTEMRFTEGGEGAELRLEGNLTLDLAGNRPRAAAGVADFASSRENGGLTVRIAARPGRAIRTLIDEGTAIVDLLDPTPPPTPPPAPPSAPAPVASTEEPKSAPAATPAPAKTAAATPTAAPPPAPAPAPPRETAAASVPDPFTLPPTTAEPSAPVTVRARAESDAEGGILLPFPRPTPAAGFERSGKTTIVFQTSDRIDLDGVPSAARAALGFKGLRQEGSFAVLTLEARSERPLRLVPDGTAWRLAVGAAATPPDDILVTRSSGADGLGEVTVALAGSSVHWILDPTDAPLAVVTTPLRQGLANPRTFVEFQLLPSFQGLVVQPNADGVRVALGRNGAIVTRASGLALSSLGLPGSAIDRHPFVIRTDQWEGDVTGDVMARYRNLVAAVSEAPRTAKVALRLDIAHLLLANGLAMEAMGVMAMTSADDPIFARRRETLLLSGIAAARAHRPVQARRFLTDETLGADPEAALWRALLDGQDGDWPRALSGIRRGEPVLARYPDELVGMFRLLVARGAAATGDIKTAEDAIAAAERLPVGVLDRNEIDFARAVVDEAAGRPTPALAAYEKLADSDLRPIAAAASLRAVLLGRKTARIPVDDAIRRLETLAVTWRGDDVELGTLGQLVRLYSETKRWRDMLTAARQANTRFATRDEARRIYETASGWFEAIFLGREGTSIEPVEFLALYYDFKEFAPVGRRGDEIVRRLADRLVEIDLLDQAATLLQHQVDHRLTGLARATVATRLAALRLMSGKPGAAITALNATRLAELPAPLRRLRLIIEAQAQADLHRTELALEAVEGEQGADFARLRATIYFNGRRWREAGEAFEGLLGTRWKDREGLTDEERQDVIRAVLADLLAEEWLALDRIRSKYAAKMADSPDAKLFEALMKPRAAQSAEFRTALREATRSDTLRRFLSDWSRVSELPPERTEPQGKAAAADGARRPG
jgi:hypothetical protein